MPSYRHHDFGNLYIIFDVKFPEHLDISDEQVRMLESVLPPRQPGVEAPKDVMMDDFQLEAIDPARDQRAAGLLGGGAGHAHGEDDEEEGMGGERVQCASQ